MFLLNFNLKYFLSTWVTFLPTHTGMPMIIAGTAIPAISVIPTGAPTSVPSCHRIFFFLLQGFFPQKVQPEGLSKQIKTDHYVLHKL